MMALLFLGLGLADDFNAGAARSLAWWRAQSSILAALWSLVVLVLLPGMLILLLRLVWRLKEELEQQAEVILGWIQNLRVSSTRAGESEDQRD